MPKNSDLIPLEAIVEVSLGEDSKSTLANLCAENDGVPRLTVGMVKKQFVTLNDAKEMLGFSHKMYARQRVRSGDLEAVKVRVKNSPRWIVTRESINAYKTRQVRRGSQRNFTLRIDPNEEAKVRRLLEQGEVEYELELSYTKKASGTKPAEETWATAILDLDEAS